MATIGFNNKIVIVCEGYRETFLHNMKCTDFCEILSVRRSQDGS